MTNRSQVLNLVYVIIIVHLSDRLRTVCCFCFGRFPVKSATARIPKFLSTSNLQFKWKEYAEQARWCIPACYSPAHQRAISMPILLHPLRLKLSKKLQISGCLRLTYLHINRINSSLDDLDKLSSLCIGPSDVHSVMQDAIQRHLFLTFIQSNSRTPSQPVHPNTNRKSGSLQCEELMMP